MCVCVCVTFETCSSSPSLVFLFLHMIHETREQKECQYLYFIYTMTIVTIRNCEIKTRIVLKIIRRQMKKLSVFMYIELGLPQLHINFPSICAFSTCNFNVAQWLNSQLASSVFCTAKEMSHSIPKEPTMENI